MASGQEIKMGKGKDEGNVDWKRRTRTFYDDKSLNDFRDSQVGKPYKLITGPTPIPLANGRIAYMVEFWTGENQPEVESPSPSPTG